MNKTNTKSAKKMKIAILAWSGIVKEKVRKGGMSITPFKQVNLELPIEFCRISKDNRLVPVIDEKSGVANKVFIATSKHTSIDKVFDELVKIEKVPQQRIGVVDLLNKQTSEAATRHSKSAMKIAAWAAKNGFDAVLWPAQGRAFKDKINVKFSVQSAANFIEELPVAQKKVAKAYINKVSHLKTPVTEYLKKEEII